ncbi:FAD-binding oxidoreductase [Sulfitobacter sp. HNIBRBA3233]|uniref:NAD(P)/FAD-dependent oxidoreductase n=1 Tax=Sulfitobacter marinivivus TaxID=3158558 RepID=UPI0032E00FA0
MRRIFDDYAYSDAPRAGCWWDATCDIADRSSLERSVDTDVAIIGAGFTGLSAALHLAQAGISVVVLDEKRIGWGASGRNGGFCCLGGAMASDDALDHRFGKNGRIAWRRTELEATRLVDRLVQANGLDVDRHSDGETCLAHRPKDMDDLREDALRIPENYGVDCDLIDKSDLPAQGMNGPFHGALNIRAGFGLNPRKYIAGLATAAENAGARIHERSAVTQLVRAGTRWKLTVGENTVTADRVIIATNGYSAEDLPDWLSARYLPSQSNVIVTRALTDDELAAQGWTTDQMAYDSRRLLHYFRLMPDRRFLFGMRGGIMTGTGAEARARARIRQDFDRMFPAWKSVEVSHGWSGMVSIARDMLPFVGALPDHPGLFAGLCYHGNGVAMGSYSGAILADLVQDKQPNLAYPLAMQQPLRRYPFGRFRRAIMPFVYAAFAFGDR